MSRCTCELRSPFPDVSHAPTCPLFRAPSHEEHQHAACYGTTRPPLDWPGEPHAPSPLAAPYEGGTELPDDIYAEAVRRMIEQGFALTRTTLVDPAAPQAVPVLPTLPEDAADRKAVPLVSGLLDYFPAALQAVAAISKVGNDQHNPGEPLHWARGKSTDEADALLRHLVDRGLIDTDGARHSAKLAWRALALLQKELEAAGEAPVSRGSWV